MLSNDESVARAIFSPRMVYQGVLQPEAFLLRESIAEEYLSVMRMVVPSWEDDMLKIPQRKNRRLYGYAEMNVGAIRKAGFLQVVFDVRACDNDRVKAHAGVFISVNGEPLVGGKRLESMKDAASQDFLLLMIQRRLVEIARKNLHVINAGLEDPASLAD